MRSTSANDDSVLVEMSRVDNAWYYYDFEESTFSILELGENYLLDYTVPDLFDCLPIGKAYIDGDYIVHHAYIIHEATEEFDADRSDYTYYFNKESKLLEKLEIIQYDNQHVVIDDCVAEISYDVNVNDIFDATAYDNVYASDKRINIEVITNYNTAEQKTHSFVATTDSTVYAIIDGKIHALYTDPEFTNPVQTLEEYSSEESLTLYAKSMFNEEIRYTVTEEEWNFYTTEHNYTIEQFGDDYYLLHKYTDDALQMGDNIILFIGDRQYNLKETEDGYVAYDCTSLEFTHYALLEGGYYDEFVYDEELCAYVLDLIEEEGLKWEIRFENGVPVSMIITEVLVVDGVEQINIVQSNYLDVGTTVIDIPEYVFEEVVTARKTVTEDEWNLYANIDNFVATFLVVHNGEYLTYSFKSIGNAVELDGKIIVFENDKKYLLEEVDGVWYAKEWNEYDLSQTLIPSEFNFDDFAYSESMQLYIQKEETGTGLFYNVGFEDGVLTSIIIQQSLDPADPGYMEIFGFSVSEFGTAEIDVPEYIIVE